MVQQASCPGGKLCLLSDCLGVGISPAPDASALHCTPWNVPEWRSPLHSQETQVEFPLIWFQPGLSPIPALGVVNQQISGCLTGFFCLCFSNKNQKTIKDTFFRPLHNIARKRVAIAPYFAVIIQRQSLYSDGCPWAIPFVVMLVSGQAGGSGALEVAVEKPTVLTTTKQEGQDPCRICKAQLAPFSK